jgi:hypothetical protein
MNNTEKKLDALIDALGFNVNEIKVVDKIAYAQRLMNVGGFTPVNVNDYKTTEFKFTKRGEPVDENKTITVPHALNMLSKRDRDIVDNFRMEMGSLGEPVVDETKENVNIPPLDTNTSYAFDGELTVNLAATEAFKNMACAARTSIPPSTTLKRELLEILKRAGKQPKKDTMTVIEHAIDKAFKNE